MDTEILGIILMYGLLVLLAIPLGKYIAGVFEYDKKSISNVFNGLDNLFFKLADINKNRPMTWKQNLVVLLTINFVWFLISLFVLSNMGWLPLNPDANPSMSADLAFNTTVSFVTNTNLQHYSGESGLSYLGQMTLMLWQFISAATGIAICAIVFNAMKKDAKEDLGNFYSYFVRTCTRILFPVALIAALIYVFNGVPMTFEGKETIITMQGDTQMVSRGPAAGFIAIKQLGTNGGGFFGVNSAHPLENPNYLTNMVETISIVLIPMALIFALGFVLNRKKLSYTIFGDETGKILFANTSAENILGLSKSELLGEEINYLAEKNDLLKVIISQKTAQSKTLKIFVDGKESYFEKEFLPISMIPTGEKLAVPNGKVIMLKNVTPFKELDFAKTNFIANVSHELKTPVAAIRMSLQLLENKSTGDLNKDQQQLITSIDEDAERILKITSELLNMTQVESGSIKIALHAVDPIKIINYAVETNRTIAESRNIKFEIIAEENLMAMMDSEKTAWVLTNLISNAIRYSYDDSVIVISLKKQKNIIEISVKDSGQGIAPEYQDKIFERYFRVPGTRKTGTGLGLSISKEFVEAQGGTIRLITELGTGSEFIASFNPA
ncbi:MAG TPA: potassium-transporting ATPase subunit KdpA [Pelobium sp.]|nr:potassium-transporting ATPase subunit KdpA [Pelobium sp.]